MVFSLTSLTKRCFTRQRRRNQKTCLSRPVPSGAHQKVVTPSTTHLLNDFSALKTIKTSHYYSSGTYPTRTDDLQINTSDALPASPRSHITGVDFAVNPTACVHKPFYSCYAFRYCLNRVRAFIHPLLQCACRLENKSKCRSYAEGSPYSHPQRHSALFVQIVRLILLMRRGYRIEAA